MKFIITALFAAVSLIASVPAQRTEGTPYDVEQEFTQGSITNEVKASGELVAPARGAGRGPVVEDERERTIDESNPAEQAESKELEEEDEGSSGEAKRIRDIIYNTNIDNRDYSINYVYNSDVEGTSGSINNSQPEVYDPPLNSMVDLTTDDEESAATSAAIDQLMAEMQQTDYNTPLTDEQFALLYEIFIGSISEEDPDLANIKTQEGSFQPMETEIQDDEFSNTDVDADMDAQSNDADEGMDLDAEENDEQEEENETEEEDENEEEDDEED